MDIEYKGGNGLVITTKKSRIVCDPNLSIIGVKDIATKESIVIATEERFLTNASDAQLTISGPGEYEIADVAVRGVAAARHIDEKTAPKLATLYRIESGDIRLALVGNVDGTLSESQLEELGVVDVLIIPVGGNGYTLDATAAAHLVRAIDAKAILPVHYADTGLNYEVPQDDLDVFKKELGAEVETVAKYKLKSSSAIPATLTVIELQRS